MPANNEEFIKKAFESGLNEQQVRAAVAERNQLLGKQYSNPEAKKGVIGTLGDIFFGRQGKWLGEHTERLKNASAGEKLYESIPVLNMLTNLDKSGKNQLGELFKGKLPFIDIDPTGVSAAGEIASYMVPGGKLGRTTALRRIGSTALQGAEMGLTRSATDIENKTLGEWGKDVATETGMGAATGALIQTPIEAAKKIAAIFPKASGWLNKEAAKMVVGKKPSEIRWEADKWEDKDINTFLRLLKTGKIPTGDYEKMAKAADKIAKADYEAIPKLLGNKTVRSTEFLGKALELGQKAQTAGRTKQEQQIVEKMTEWLASQKKVMTEKEVYNMRQALNYFVKSNAFQKVSKDLPIETEIERGILSKSREWLIKQHPNDNLADLLSEESSAIALRNYLERGAKRGWVPRALGTIFYFISSIPTRLLQRPQVLSKVSKGTNILNKVPQGAKSKLSAMARMLSGENLTRVGVPYEAYNRMLNQ